MAGKKAVAGTRLAENYRHPESESPMRPDVGTQAQFKKKKQPSTYRYDSSLSPALDWDGQNSARERGEWLLARAEEAAALPAPHEFEKPQEFKNGGGKIVASVAGLQDAIRRLKALGKPFLNWAGKAERLSFDVPTLPLFVHERLSTKAIIETLVSHKRDKQLGMFELFGDPQHSITDQVLRAYEHRDKWVNRMTLGDSLVVMNSLLRYEGLGGQVQMIYMDPPYGVKFGSNFQPFVRKRDVVHNDDEDMTREPEMVQAYRDTWELGLHSYLTYLRDRLLLARDLLTPSGSFFLQISDENLHHVREILDEVFGPENFVAVITYAKTTSTTGDDLSVVNDYILWYFRDREHGPKMEKLYKRKRPGETGGMGYNKIQLSEGEIHSISEFEDEGLPNGARICATDNLTSSRPPGDFPVQFAGRTWKPKRGYWKTGEEGMQRLVAAKRLYASENTETLSYVRLLDDFPYFEVNNIWTDTVGQNQFGTGGKVYAVQTANIAIQRCLLMATSPGDLVLDPTCGSGTTAYVAEQWGRRWITIDTSRVPLALSRQRLLTATFPWYELKDELRGPAGGFSYVHKLNKKGEEVGGIVPHVTLESIANNEPPKEEVLVDRPEIDNKITRVTGPFCVEATIPTPAAADSEFRIADSGGATPAGADSEFRIADSGRATPAGADSEYRMPDSGRATPTAADSEFQNSNSRQEEWAYVDRMLEILRKSPVLRLEGNRTVTLRNVRPPAKTLSLSAEALVDATANGQTPTLAEAVQEAAEKNGKVLPLSAKLVAFVFGPENGAVSEKLVYEAAREAHAKDYTHLYVIGFAIQPHARDLVSKCAEVVGIAATYVQATPDIMMGDLLKNMRSSQIFSVCGLPEIDLRPVKGKTKTDSQQYEVELLGLDVFDPATMEPYHRRGEEVPAWFLDTDYNGLCFHVSQAFFPRTGAWENLKKALKGEYEESVWEHLAGTVSAPFEAGEQGQVAVKVIDERGNELLVVQKLP